MADNRIKLFNNPETSLLTGVAYKSFLLKRKIIFELATNKDLTVTDLSTILNVSNPTVTKSIIELIEDGYVCDLGKIETSGGRRPQNYGLINDAGYFLGVDMLDDHINFELIDINKNQMITEMGVEYTAENSHESLNKLADVVSNFIERNAVSKEKILGIGMSLRGRVDSSTGHSYNIFNFDPRPLSQLLTIKTGITTIIENDTRAMAYAEWTLNSDQSSQNALFINASKGIGVGIIINGKLFYGKSGFSGEFGHIPFFDNQMICHCGKKGCLETEASGAALKRIFIESLEQGASSILSESYKKNGTITLREIMDAATKDDVLSIELITNVGEKLGRGIGVLINLFNPELVVIGGVLSSVGDYLMLPIRTALNKYSLSLVNRDSQLAVSKLGESAGVIGSALLARNRILEIEG